MTSIFTLGWISIALLAILLFTYIRWKRLPIPRTGYFKAFIIVQIATVLFNMFTLWCNTYPGTFPPFIEMLLNSCYFFFYFVRGYFFFSYTLSLLDGLLYKGKAAIIFGRILVTANALMLVLAFFAPNGHSVSDPLGGYQGGFAAWVITLECSILLAVGFLVLVIYRKRLHSFEFLSVIVSYAIPAIGFIGYVITPRSITVDAFYVLSTYLLFIALESGSLCRDQLTQLFNYQSFGAVLRDRIANNRPCRLCAVIIRNYPASRQIYDGRQVDKALEQIGQFLSKSFPKVSAFYAQSGRFLLLGPKDTNTKELLTQIRNRFDQPWENPRATIFFDIVFGELDHKVRFESTSLALEGFRFFLRSAENDTDSDYILVDDEVIQKIKHEFDIRKSLRSAIDEKRVSFFLQPIIQANTGRVVGAEALARIFDPQGGLLMPDEFIPIAESDGSITELGAQIFDKVCQFIHDNNIHQMGLKFINVNLSPIQCRDRNLPFVLDSILNKWRVAPELIQLEITEASLIEENTLRSQMENLIGFGFSFVLDDYGTGYANQFRMREFPFKGLKLDMRIVWAHFKNPDQLLPNMVSTLSSMGMPITAEGVEDVEMAKGLKEIGCTYLQGFHYAPPIPTDEFLLYVRRTNRII